jgi:hypothetical protein
MTPDEREVMFKDLYNEMTADRDKWQWKAESRERELNSLGKIILGLRQAIESFRDLASPTFDMCEKCSACDPPDGMIHKEDCEYVAAEKAIDVALDLTPTRAEERVKLMEKLVTDSRLALEAHDHAEKNLPGNMGAIRDILTTLDAMELE